MGGAGRAWVCPKGGGRCLTPPPPPSQNATRRPPPPQCVPAASFTEDERKKLTERIQNAGTEVVEAKAGKGSATLSMAYAAARMAESTLLGLSGEANIYECTFVESKARRGGAAPRQCRAAPVLFPPFLIFGLFCAQLP